MGQYFLYWIGQQITYILPISWTYALAICVANIQCFISSKDRLAVHHNLSLIYKRRATDQEVQQVFQNFARYMVDFLSMTRRVDHQYIKEHVVVDGIECLRDVLAQGKGGILVSAHLGNWEMGGTVLPQLGYPISAIALSHNNEKVNEFFNKQRETHGSKVIQANMAVRRVIEQLRMNRLVAILAERDFGQRGFRMPFLNATASIPKGAAIFSMKTGAPIIPCFFIREQGESFRIYFDQAIYPPENNSANISDDKLKDYIQQYLVSIERYITKYPTQWLMFRDFTQS